MSKTALEKQLEGKNIIESRIILRDAKIENQDDAKLVIETFNTAKPISKEISLRRTSIQMFEGILKNQQARGQETSSLEKNIRDWKKEIAVMEKAVQLVGYAEV